GLYPEERRWAVPFIVLTTLAFVAGVVFARFLVLPFALPILLAFLGDAATAVLSIGDFISKMLLYMAVFGIIFEMPVLGFLLARLGLIQAAWLRQYRRHAIVAGLLIAAVITPTGDPFNFALVGVPLVVLYEVSILVVRLSQRKVERGSKDPEFTSPN
ncbi:MAG: twin-arginine translocase subunit TatC, partial [Truepera sp.]|nr:twin-arginine translocase subunit TatC [Truepera sp.]